MSRRNRGFTVIEVLVALLITTIGIVGVASLQVVSLQQNRNTLLRDQALQAGNDILDRMRANPDTAYAPVGIDARPSSSFDCVAHTCSRTQMKDFDIAQWKCRINPLDDNGDLYEVCNGFTITQASLPGGKGSIAKVGTVHEVTVQWFSDRQGNSTSITLRTQSCSQISSC